MKRLAVIFPGIGYTAGKPLLHYCRRLAERFGYETVILPYSGFPKKVTGDRDRLRKSCELALKQAKELLADTDLDSFGDVLFIGKSIGTVVAADIAAKSSAKDHIRFIIYTPLEETFSYPLSDAVVFTGSEDPWVGGETSRIPALCGERGIPCFVVPDANHSLETDDPQKDIQNLQEIMRHTAAFIRKEQLRRISHYEALLQDLQRSLTGSGFSGTELSAVREKADALAEYYGSTDWKLDFADDEAGLLPSGLKRGVLSEDGICNALEQFRELFS